MSNASGPIDDFLRGFLAPFHFVRWAWSRPRIWIWHLLPLLILVPMYAGLWAGGWLLLGAGLEWIQSFLQTVLDPSNLSWLGLSGVAGGSGGWSGWMGWIHWILWGLFALSTVTFFSVFGAWACAPLLETLVRVVHGEAHPDLSLPPSRGFFSCMYRETKRTTVLILAALFNSILGWAPGLQPLSIAGAAFLLSAEFLGLGLTPWQPSTTAVLAWITKRWTLSLGLGFGLMVLLAIPWLSVFSIPLAAATASWLVAQEGQALDALSTPSD